MYVLWRMVRTRSAIAWSPFASACASFLLTLWFLMRMTGTNVSAMRAAVRTTSSAEDVCVCETEGEPTRNGLIGRAVDRTPHVP